MIILSNKNLRVKDSKTGTYEGINAIAKERSEEYVDRINESGEGISQQIAEKGARVLESIPEDYSTLSGDVADLKESNKEINTTLKTVKEEAEKVSETTLSFGLYVDENGYLCQKLESEE